MLWADICCYLMVNGQIYMYVAIYLIGTSCYEMRGWPAVSNQVHS